MFPSKTELFARAVAWYHSDSFDTASGPPVPSPVMDNVVAFGGYTKLALLDPKAPLEIKAMGPTLWASANVIPATFLMWHIDPLDYREREGLDESYDMWSGVRTRVDRVKQPVDDFFSNSPTIWDTWN